MWNTQCLSDKMLINLLLYLKWNREERRGKTAGPGGGVQGTQHLRTGWLLQGIENPFFYTQLRCFQKQDEFGNN